MELFLVMCFVNLTIYLLLIGGTSMLLLASNTVSGLSVLNLHVRHAFPIRFSSSCTPPESVNAAKQFLDSKNSTTWAYSGHTLVWRKFLCFLSLDITFLR